MGQATLQRRCESATSPLSIIFNALVIGRILWKKCYTFCARQGLSRRHLLDSRALPVENSTPGTGPQDACGETALKFSEREPMALVQTSIRASGRRRSFRGVLLWAIAAWCSIGWSPSTPVQAAESAPCTSSCSPAICPSLPRPQDEIWLISSRGFYCAVPANIGQALQYWRYEAGRWVPSDHTAFAAGDAAVRVTMFAHGNDVDMHWSVQCGWSVYAAQIQAVPDQEPTRFVIYSWPSEKTYTRPVIDVRSKCARADIDAYCFAWLIDELGPTTPLSLCGYSLGSRIVGGAQQLVAGGAIDGRPLAGLKHPQRPAARVVHMAAAIDSDWLLPGRRYDLAMSETEHLILLNNSCDRALRFYHRIYCKHGGPEAVGYIGMPTAGLPSSEQAKSEQYDLCCQIGPDHSWMHYTQTPSVAVVLGRGLAGDRPQSEPAAKKAASASSTAEPLPETPLPAADASGNGRPNDTVSEFFGREKLLKSAEFPRFPAHAAGSWRPRYSRALDGQTETRQDC